mmetsp:Transcript_12555/g.40571  ORF Transcript_12555/g.40571 Transcript_12555/m.40571 type:complete len:222 (+) Transcript_12555:168-833(+)
MWNRLGGAGGPEYFGFPDGLLCLLSRPSIGSPHRSTPRMAASRSALSSYCASGRAEYSASCARASRPCRFCTSPRPHTGAGAGAGAPPAAGSAFAAAASVSRRRPCLSRRTVSAPAPSAAASTACSRCALCACSASACDTTLVCSPGAEKAGGGAGPSSAGSVAPPPVPLAMPVSLAAAAPSTLGWAEVRRGGLGSGLAFRPRRGGLGSGESWRAARRGGL